MAAGAYYFHQGNIAHYGCWVEGGGNEPVFDAVKNGLGKAELEQARTRFLAALGD